MNWADWFIIAVVSVSTLISIKRGFIKEALSLLVWVAAFVIARVFSFKMADLLVGYIDAHSVRLAAAFAILFAATLVVGALVTHLINVLVRATGLTGTDRLLGMIFGVARGCLVVVIAVALAKHTPFSGDQWWQESYFIPQFLVMEEWSFDLLKQLSNYLLNFNG